MGYVMVDSRPSNVQTNTTSVVSPSAHVPPQPTLCLNERRARGKDHGDRSEPPGGESLVMRETIVDKGPPFPAADKRNRGGVIAAWD